MHPNQNIQGYIPDRSCWIIETLRAPLIKRNYWQRSTLCGLNLCSYAYTGHAKLLWCVSSSQSCSSGLYIPGEAMNDAQSASHHLPAHHHANDINWELRIAHDYFGYTTTFCIPRWTAQPFILHQVRGAHRAGCNSRPVVENNPQGQRSCPRLNVTQEISFSFNACWGT